MSFALRLLSAPLAGVGGSARRGLAAIGRALRFLLRLATVQQPSWSGVPAHVSAIALPSLAPVLAVSGFIGVTATLMGYHAFLPLGTQEQIGSFAGLLTLRELSPLLAGAMIAAKSGTALTATLAIMRGSDQLDAMEVMGVDPYGFLLWPRAVAFILVGAPLVVFADAAALLASFGTAVAELGITPAAFASDLFRFVGPRDLAIGILKGVVFSAIAGGISAYQGFFASRGSRGVSRAITRAMVSMTIADVAANVALSSLFYR